MRLRLSTYNTLTVGAVGSWPYVLDQFRAPHTVGLTGTPIATQIDVEQGQMRGFCVPGGASPKVSRTTAKVLSCFSIRPFFSPRYVHTMYTPPDGLRGRIGMVRMHSKWYEVAFIVVCTLVEPRGSAAPQHTDAVWSELHRIVAHLPARCVPWLLMDANAHIGKSEGADLLPNGHVGPCEAVEMNTNGTCMHTFFQAAHLAATNIVFRTGPTLFSNNGVYSSRIDYSCGVCSMLYSVDKCAVWYKAGKRLQLAR